MPAQQACNDTNPGTQENQNAKSDQHSRVFQQPASRIGDPITGPVVLEPMIATHGGFLADQLRGCIEDIAVDQLRNIAGITDDFIEGKIRLF